MMTPAPRLETRHLVLRGPEKRDLAPFTTWLTRSARMDMLDGVGTEGDAWRGFIAGIGHWQWHGYGFFMVEEKATGLAAGRVGILNHVTWPGPELAWHLFDGFEGRSIAYEAAVAVRNWAGETLDLPPLISLIEPRNTRSSNLAKRLGASVTQEMTVDDTHAQVYQHLPFDDATAQAQRAEVAA